MFRTLKMSIGAAAAAVAAIAVAAPAHADNIDFGTDQAACKAAAQQANASGNASAFCFQTGPGHYALYYTRR